MRPIAPALSAAAAAGELTAEGSAVLHTDHREVHLGGLALQTENIVWKTDPASHPTVRYADNRVAIRLYERAGFVPIGGPAADLLLIG